MPLILRKQLDQYTEMGIWEITETVEELITKYQFNVPEPAVFERFKPGKRKLHWLSSRILLKELLGEEQPVKLQVDIHLKPHLTSSSHHISISHSAAHAAVIISSKCRVGIDIEEIQPKITRIATKFLSDAELDFLETGEHRVSQLYACWTAKEALYKLQGKRQVSFKDNILVSPFTFSQAGVIDSLLLNELGNKNYLINYQTFGSYMLAWVIE